MQPNNKRSDINGVVLIDKPLGYSSNQTLSLVKKIFNAKKAGHTGTLDPLATGLLPICFGEATKFSSFSLESNKSYEASIKLGSSSTTGDLEGEIKSWRIKNFPTIDAVQKTINKFLGVQEQIPPMFSALKHKGKPLYEYARKGENIERKKRAINILKLELLEYKNNFLKIYVECSKGTYIRSLANDIGEDLKTGGHLTGLKRTSIGSIVISDSLTIDSIEAMNDAKKKDCLLPTDFLIKDKEKIILDTMREKLIKDGKALPIKDYVSGTYRLYNQKNIFFGLGNVDLYGYLTVKRLLATN